MLKVSALLVQLEELSSRKGSERDKRRARQDKSAIKSAILQSVAKSPW